MSLQTSINYLQATREKYRAYVRNHEGLLAYKERLEKVKANMLPFMDREDMWAGTALKVRETVTALDNTLGQFEKDHRTQLETYTDRKEKLTLSQQMYVLYSTLLEKVTSSYVSQLDDVLNEVYFYVYRHQDRKIKLVLEEKYGKKVINPKFITTDQDGTEYQEDVEDEGFSVSVVLGTIFLVYFILYNNLPKVILFDETFGGLSQETIERFFPFLKIFNEQMGFSFLFISHDQLRIEQFMTKIYQVSNGVYTLQE